MAPNRDVFINCPFDPAYKTCFRAIVFVVVRSGFRPRCALELDDASENRFQKICQIIAECQYGVHDISRTTLDAANKLPRFNMPLELGVFLGAKKFNRKQASKRCIIFDLKPYRYQKFISDIAGQDVHSHGGKAATLIAELAAWLRDQSGDRKVPGGRKIGKEFARFVRDLPGICKLRQLQPSELTFGDLAELVAQYVARPSKPVGRKIRR